MYNSTYFLFPAAVLGNQKFERPNVEMMDGEVTVRWNQPAAASINSTYNVHFAK